MFWRITAILILLAFYSIYIGKMFLQKRQGIQTDQIAKREKRDKIFYTELLMKIATYSVVMIEAVSIFTVESDLPIGILIIGVLLGIAGDIIAFFGVCGCHAAFADTAGGEILACGFWRGIHKLQKTCVQILGKKRVNWRKTDGDKKMYQGSFFSHR